MLVNFTTLVPQGPLGLGGGGAKWSKFDNLKKNSIFPYLNKN